MPKLGRNLKQKDSTGYRFELDGIRAICIIFTICNHLPDPPQFINGSIGVDIFFALSGWLITSLLLQEQSRTATIDIWSFYIRRIFRIVPLYALTVAAYGLAVLLIPAERLEFASAFWYLISFNREYLPEVSGNTFGHAWTLGIEEKFYLFWPLAITMCAGRMWRALAAAGLFYFVLAWLADWNTLVIRGYCGLTFGTFLALIGQWQPMAKVLAKSGTGNIALFIMALLYCVSLLIPNSGWNVAMSLSASILIGSLWMNPDQPSAKALAFRPLAAVGKLTYGIYLLHVLCINVVVKLLELLEVSLPSIVKFLVCYIFAVGIGFVAHVTVEKPLIRIGRNLTKRRADKIAAPAQAKNPVALP